MIRSTVRTSGDVKDLIAYVGNLGVTVSTTRFISVIQGP